MYANATVQTSMEEKTNDLIETITQALNDIIQKAKSNKLSYKLIQVLETKRDLLEYDLPSTSQEKKNKILDELYRNYCGANFNYNAPFFATEKKSPDGKEDEKNNINYPDKTKIFIENSQNMLFCLISYFIWIHYVKHCKS